MTGEQKSKKASSWWYILLLAPFVGTLWPAFYSYDEPRLAGIPFFYWYQFLWVIISAVLTAVVYVATKRK
ncbi:DUF3311 domain-containing protein [Paenibacillus humicola]|uniref:DUF3311 domain-containing protein n=1 Tax=Paenibacillus humicola TaxID=3110540 RepID=UPI00237B3FCF|nr:DUF3311 domain-containing protein [Paenibacillus humicola]